MEAALFSSPGVLSAAAPPRARAIPALVDPLGLLDDPGTAQLAADIDGMPDGEPILQGFLRKEGTSRESWKRRWFVLRKDSLEYLKRQDSEAIQGVIPVGNVAGIAVDTHAYGQPHSFQLITPGRVYALQAPLEAAQRHWLSAIAAVVYRYHLRGAAAAPAAAYAADTAAAAPAAAPASPGRSLQPEEPAAAAGEQQQQQGGSPGRRARSLGRQRSPSPQRGGQPPDGGSGGGVMSVAAALSMLDKLSAAIAARKQADRDKKAKSPVRGAPSSSAAPAQSAAAAAPAAQGRASLAGAAGVAASAPGTAARRRPASAGSAPQPSARKPQLQQHGSPASGGHHHPPSFEVGEASLLAGTHPGFGSGDFDRILSMLDDEAAAAAARAGHRSPVRGAPAAAAAAGARHSQRSPTSTASPPAGRGRMVLRELHAEEEQDGGGRAASHQRQRQQPAAAAGGRSSRVSFSGGGEPGTSRSPQGRAVAAATTTKRPPVPQAAAHAAAGDTGANGRRSLQRSTTGGGAVAPGARGRSLSRGRPAASEAAAGKPPQRRPPSTTSRGRQPLSRNSASTAADSLGASSASSAAAAGDHQQRGSSLLASISSAASQQQQQQPPAPAAQASRASQHRLEYAKRWINSLGVPGAPLLPLERGAKLGPLFANGVLLCSLLATADPAARAALSEGGGAVNPKPRSHAACVANVEAALRVLGRHGHVRKLRMPTAAEVTSGGKEDRLAGLLAEVFDAYALRRARLAGAGTMAWLRRVVDAYGVTLPGPGTTAAADGGGASLPWSGLWRALRDGAVLALLAHYHGGDASLVGPKHGIDLAGVHVRPASPALRSANIRAAVPVLADLGARFVVNEALLAVHTPDDAPSGSGSASQLDCDEDDDAALLQLRMLQDCLAPVPCALPDLGGNLGATAREAHAEALNAGVVGLTSLAVGGSSSGVRVVVGARFADCDAWAEPPPPPPPVAVAEPPPQLQQPVDDEPAGRRLSSPPRGGRPQSLRLQSHSPSPHRKTSAPASFSSPSASQQQQQQQQHVPLTAADILAERDRLYRMALDRAAATGRASTAAVTDVALRWATGKVTAWAVERGGNEQLVELALAGSTPPQHAGSSAPSTDADAAVVEAPLPSRTASMQLVAPDDAPRGSSSGGTASTSGGSAATALSELDFTNGQPMTVSPRDASDEVATGQYGAVSAAPAAAAATRPRGSGSGVITPPRPRQRPLSPPPPPPVMQPPVPPPLQPPAPQHQQAPPQPQPQQPSAVTSPLRRSPGRAPPPRPLPPAVAAAATAAAAAAMATVARGPRPQQQLLLSPASTVASPITPSDVTVTGGHAHAEVGGATPEQLGSTLKPRQLLQAETPPQPEPAAAPAAAVTQPPPAVPVVAAPQQPAPAPAPVSDAAAAAPAPVIEPAPAPAPLAEAAPPAPLVEAAPPAPPVVAVPSAPTPPAPHVASDTGSEDATASAIVEEPLPSPEEMRRLMAEEEVRGWLAAARRAREAGEPPIVLPSRDTGLFALPAAEEPPPAAAAAVAKPRPSRAGSRRVSLVDTAAPAPAAAPVQAASLPAVAVPLPPPPPPALAVAPTLPAVAPGQRLFALRMGGGGNTVLRGFRVDKGAASPDAAVVSWAAPGVPAGGPADGAVRIGQLVGVNVKADAAGGTGLPVLTLRLPAAAGRGMSAVEVLPVDASEQARRALKAFGSELAALYAAAQMSALASSASASVSDASAATGGPFAPPTSSSAAGALPFPLMGPAAGGASGLPGSGASTASSKASREGGAATPGVHSFYNMPPPPPAKPTAAAGGGSLARAPTPPLPSASAPAPLAAAAGAGSGTAGSALRSALAARGLSLPGDALAAQMRRGGYAS